MSTITKPSRKQLIRQVDSLKKQVRELKRLKKEKTNIVSGEKREKENFKSIVENSADGIILSVLQTGQILYVNKKFGLMSGYKKSELMKMNIIKLVSAGEKTRAKDILKKIRRGKRTSIKYEAFLRRKDRKNINVEATISKIRWHDEPVLVAMVRDITERKQAEETLKYTEEKLTTLLNNVPVSVYRSTPGGKVLSANPALLRIFGYRTEEEYCALPASKSYLNKKRRQEFVKELRKSGSVHNFESQMIRKDGKIIWVSANATVTRDKNGNIKYIDGTEEDITETKQSEETLKKSEEKLRLIFDSSPIAIEYYNSEGYCIDANKAAIKMFGLSKSDFLFKYNFLNSPFVDEEVKSKCKKGIPVRYGKWVDFNEISGEKIYKTDRDDMIYVDTLITPIISREKLKPSSYIVQIQDSTKRKRAEEKLRESEKRYRQLVELSPDAIMIHQDGMFIFVNEAAKKMFNAKSKNDFMGKPIIDRVHPDYRDIVKQRVKNLDDDRLNRVPVIEEKFIKFDGTVFDVEVTANHFLYDGKDAVQVIARDITERMRAAEKLRISEERLRMIIENSRDGINLLDLSSGKYIFMSPSQIEMTGFTANEIVNISVKEALERVHPDDRVISLNQQEQVVAGIDPTPAEYRWKVKSGEYRWFSDSRKLVRDSEGSPIAMVGISRDITERRLAEEALRESEEKYRTLFEANQDGISVCYINLDGTLSSFVDLNNPAAEMIGYTKEEIINLKISNFEKDISEKAMKERKKEINSKGIASFETVAKHKDGHNVILETKAILINYNNRPALMSIIRDITERRRAENALLVSEERYRNLFEQSPISLWEEDYSDVKKYIDDLKENGVDDFRSYFETHPDVTSRCAKMVKILSFNKAAKDLFAIKTKDELKDGLSKFFIEESYPVFIEQLIAVAEGKTHIEIEKKLQTMKGEQKFVNIFWNVPLGSEDTFSRILISIVDITERKKTELALRESQLKFKTMFDESPIGIELYRADGLQVDANKSSLRMFGIPNVNEIRKFNIFDGISLDSDKKAKLRRGEPIEYQSSFDFDRIKELGQYKSNKIGKAYFDYIITPLFGSERKTIEGYLLQVQDITERKKDEDVIKKSEYLLRQSQKIARLGSYTLNISTGIWTSSDVLDEIFGIDENYVRDVNGWLDLVHPGDREKMRKYFQSNVLVQYNQFDKEYRIINLRDKMERWVHGLGEFEFDKEGKVVKMIGTIQDITERRKTEKSLRESRTQLRSLANRLQVIREEERANVAREIHDDLGQSLTALKMDVMWLKKNYNLHWEKTPEKFNTIVNLIDSTIKTVKHIASELRPGILDDLGLIPAIEWQKDDFQNRFNIKCNLIIGNKNIAPDNETSVAVFRILQETLTNIARHSSATEADIVLDLKDNKLLTMEVSDNGIGINIEQATSNKSLGIFGMRERVNLLNGQLEISGKAGKGTKVKIRIPVSEKE